MGEMPSCSDAEGAVGTDLALSPFSKELPPWEQNVPAMGRIYSHHGKPHRADPCTVKRNSNMQQTTIRFDHVLQEQQRVDVAAPARKAVQVINHWLDSRSEFYSRILGQAITWRKALRIGVVLPLLFVTVAACGMQAPLASLACTASAGWIVYRLNKEEGGEK